MNDPRLIAADAQAFRAAVHRATPYKPIYVKLKLIWACNLRCAMCNHWRDPVEAPMATERLLDLIDELAGLGCQKIHLSGGEPTLRPDLELLIRRMNRYGIRATMTTNGTRLTPERAQALAEAGLHKVNISLDSPDPQIHDRIRGVAGAWADTVRGLRYLRPWLQREQAIRINTVVSPWNYQSLAQLPDLAHSLGADRINLIPMDFNTPDITPLTFRQILWFNAVLAPQIARKALFWNLITERAQAYPFGTTWSEIQQSLKGNYSGGYYNHHRCYAPWTHALVDHVGRVSVCCMTTNQVIMGDLREQSFTQIWQGATYQELRQCGSLPQLAACQKCDMFLAQNRQLEQILQG